MKAADTSIPSNDSQASIATTPCPPYYAVVFTSIKTDADTGYAQMADKMVALAKQQRGFLGIESAREAVDCVSRHTLGITVSYWHDLASITAWKQHIEHLEAQRLGKDKWYTSFTVRIAKVERAYHFNAL